MRNIRPLIIISLFLAIPLLLFAATKHNKVGIITDPLEVSVKSGTLIFSGLTIIRQQHPKLTISTPYDLSKINEKITNLDIALVPLLENVPKLFLSDEDWGIYQFTDSGIEYRSKKLEDVNFIPFKEEIQPSIKNLFEKYDKNSLLLENKQLTKESIILNFDTGSNQENIITILQRGKNQLLTVYRDERHIAKILPNEKVNLASFYLLAGLIEEIPGVFKSRINRNDWYWIPENHGITFVNKKNAKREFIKFTNNIAISKLPETKHALKRLRHYKDILRGNHILNKLDLLALSNEKKLYTQYDKLRLSIHQKNQTRCPLSFSSYESYKQVATREKVPIQQISNFRFSLRELRLLQNALNISIDQKNAASVMEYFSYRPSMSMSFTYEYSPNLFKFFLKPIYEIDITQFKKLIISEDLNTYTNQFHDDYFTELKFINTILHEQAHHTYDRLSQTQKKMYSAISWDPDSWNNDLTLRKIDTAMETPKNHFMIVYPDWPPFKGHESSSEDFTNHVASYRMFGSSFQKESAHKPALKAKYQFIKEHVFTGTAFDQNYQIP